MLKEKHYFSNVVNGLKELNWRILLLGVFFLYFYKLIFYRYAADPATFLQNVILKPLMIILLCLMVFLTDIRKEKMFWLFVACFGVLCGLCLINNTGILSFGPIMAFSTIGCFFIPYVVPKKYLEPFIKLVMSVFVALYLVLGIIGIITVLKWYTGEEWAFGWLFRVKLYSDSRLYLINHPNYSGLGLIIAAFFAVVLLLSTKNKILKALLGFSLAINMVAIALTNSRVALLTGCVGLGLAAGSYMYQKFYNGSLKKKILAVVLSVVAIITVIFIMNNIIIDSFNSIGEYIKSKQSPPIQITEQIKNDDTDMKEAVLPEREFFGNSIHDALNGREYLWQGIFGFMNDEPSIYLKGYSPVLHRIMERLPPYYPPEGHAYFGAFVHPHSDYFYILPAFGILGLVVVAIFIFIQIKHSIRLVFLQKAEGDFPFYLFPAFVAMILTSGLTEWFVTNTDVGYIMPMLFLAAGCICFYTKKDKQAIENK